MSYKDNRDFEVITVGAATLDIFVLSKKLLLMKSARFSNGVGECLSLGSKMEVDDLHFASGGGASNAAATFSSLGFRTAIFAEVGDDISAEHIKDELLTHKIRDFSYRNENRKTALSIILAIPGSDRAILTYRGASAEFSVGHFPLSSTTTQTYYVTSLRGNIAGYSALLDRAEALGARVAWNPGGSEFELGFSRLLPFLKRTQFLILNREEAALLTKLDGNDVGTLLNELCASAEYVALTDGPNGAWLCRRGAAWRVKARKIKVRNTTGAGDAFGSGLIAGMMKYRDPIKALALATLNAESVIQSIGAKTAILKKWPSERELEDVQITKW